mmetsp:Transcript_4500/g.13331  ORF Transcript_4500/g.13331 Transcript_4500/m.13331 type:complete len:213 (-) Transcript_4500:1667-2305(-)
MLRNIGPVLTIGLQALQKQQRLLLAPVLWIPFRAARVPIHPDEVALRDSRRKRFEALLHLLEGLHRQVVIRNFCAMVAHPRALLCGHVANELDFFRHWLRGCSALRSALLRHQGQWRDEPVATGHWTIEVDQAVHVEALLAGYHLEFRRQRQSQVFCLLVLLLLLFLLLLLLALSVLLLLDLDELLAQLVVKVDQAPMLQERVYPVNGIDVP